MLHLEQLKKSCPRKNKYENVPRGRFFIGGFL
jgi:hypothetical protein